ncbi:MAG: HAMP domain-containing histidine kinase [Ruminococcaceae bacterium]|nr:HAMP domain-containing histidine kinase [Oscillospiraceae bacterium]
MGRIKKWLCGIPLPAAFIICALCCILAAFGSTKATIWLAEEKLNDIIDKYKSDEIVKIIPTDNSEFFAILGDDNNINNGDIGFEYIPPENNSSDEDQLTSGDLIGFNIQNNIEYGTNLNESEFIDFPATVVPINTDEHIVRYSLLEEDQKRYDFFSWLNGIAAILWYSVCLVAAALVFYLWKIKRPFRILNAAVQKISENDLNFQINYESQDEFGRLCQAFEVMRQELVKSNCKMWNSIEERKRLNAAFAHDLRTPLTVIRGYIDLLLDNVGNNANGGETIGFVNEISDQIVRLNKFTDTMGTLQRLEDYEPCYKSVSSSEITGMISETAAMLFLNGKTEIISELDEQNLNLDKGALAQICENVLSNAARHAKEKIIVQICQEQKYIMITVEDDGEGFTEKDLENAALAYYRGEKTGSGTSPHFGLGLYISSLLAEKLGGNIRLDNGEKGGAKISIKIRTI